MKIAILSDFHANLYALQAVLDDISTRGIEQFWCLGDMVGYYPDPVEPLMFVQRYVDDDDWVMGNHDAMLADLLLPHDEQGGVEIDSKVGPIRVRGKFLSLEAWQMTNATPIRALELNRADLDSHEEAGRFWRTTFRPERTNPRHVSIDGREYLRVHASQHDHTGRYLYGWQHEISLPEEFQALKEGAKDPSAPQTLCFGHTHVPTLVFGDQQDGEFAMEAIFIKPGEIYPLGRRWALINPGSVGQSRDGDRRASYAILETDSQVVTFVRVPYLYQETAYRVLQKGYPESLARKLLDAPPVKEMPEIWKKHHARGGVPTE